MTSVKILVERIDAAQRIIRDAQADSVRAESQLRAITRHQGVLISADLLDGVLPETRQTVAPIINATGRLPYLGDRT